MTWGKLIGSEICLNTRHIRLFFYLSWGWGQINLSPLFSVVQEKEPEGSSSLRSVVFDPLVCLPFVGVSLFGVHLYVNVTLPFLKCEQPNPAATQAKAQVLSLLLSH